MPTYDYECRFCAHRFEHFQGINDAKLRKCPECKRNGLDRLFGTGAGVVFKGSGFYETDYKRAAGKGAKTPGGDGETAPESSDAKSNAKPNGEAKPSTDSSESGSKRESDAKAKPQGKPASKPDKSDS